MAKKTDVNVIQTNKVCFPEKKHANGFTAVAALSLTLGVKVNMRLSKIVFDTTPVLTRMYLQLHVCEAYKNNYTAVEQRTDNLELLYLPSTNKRV